jgi:Arc/MetJ family transcription regulator
LILKFLNNPINPITTTLQHGSTASLINLLIYIRDSKLNMIDKCAFLVYPYTHKEVYMRTNIVLNDSLIRQGFKLSGAKTKKELVNQALKEFVENRKRLDLMDLAGKIEFARDYNYKALRTGK